MSDDLAVLDIGVLDELRASVGDDEGFVRDLVETYLAEGPAHMAQVAAAAASADAEAIVRPAHTLKSSSAALGLTRMSAISTSSSRPSCLARSMMAVPWVSSAQTNVQWLPRSFWNRTQISVWMYSTKWPR